MAPGGRLTAVFALACAAAACGHAYAIADDPARADGGATDAATTSGDAAAPTDAGACDPTQHAICDDFERATVAGGPWDTVDVVPPGTLSLTTGSAHSATHALAVDQPAFDGGVLRTELVKTITKADVTHVTCSFWLRIDALSAENNAYGTIFRVDTLAIPASEAQGTVELVSLPHQLLMATSETLMEGGTQSSPTYNTAGLVETARWAQVALDVDFAKRSVTATVDGVSPTTNLMSTAITKNNGVRIALGAWTSDVENRYSVDDVVCDAE